jgi:predicted nucleic acid-binding protein
VLLDTNVLVRHLTGDPEDQAGRATAFLRAADRLALPALVVAELVYVLESVYGRSREEIAVLVRAILAHPPVVAPEEPTLLRAVELYETRGVHFAEAYLAALAERRDGRVASFDRDLDRIETVVRVEP